MTAEIIVLEARIRQELFQLHRVVEELESTLKQYKQKPVTSKTVLRALGSILHDFYSGAEKIFLNIAKEIDHTAPKTENWHRLLLEQMTLHLKERRPPVITADLASRLQQYLAFRHRFRNLYGFELKWERMNGLVWSLPETFQKFSGEMELFLNLLQTANEEEDEE